MACILANRKTWLYISISDFDDNDWALLQDINKTGSEWWFIENNSVPLSTSNKLIEPSSYPQAIALPKMKKINEIESKE